MIGQAISHYKITAKLGAGGMGEVYLATDTKLDRPVALKFLPERLTRDAGARERLLREAQAASKLNHPNILTIHAVEESDDRVFIVMEYVAGQPLSELIAAGSITVERAVTIAQDVAAALEAAHKAGIVHRDIKPDNILVDQDGRTRVCDFGLAKAGGIGRLSGKHVVLGTMPYMSPEQSRGEPVDHRTDIWALGVVIYEMVTGRRPFPGDYEQAVIYAILNEEPAALSAHRPDVPEGLTRVVAKALQKDPADRYASAADLAADLAAFPDVPRSDSPRSTDRPQAIPSVAVLPFVDMSPEKDQEYFCDGIAEQLISDLSKVNGLRVVARTSAFAFKGKDEDIRTLGRRLAVTTVLEGSVRKADNRLRVTAQLINVADGFHLWSESYDRDLKDIFAIQDEVAQIIVSTLSGRLVGGKTEPGRRPTENVEAYNHYLRGLHHWNKRTEGNLERALNCFKEAVSLDPAFALAHVGVANTWLILGSWGNVTFAEYIRMARAAVDRALALDNRMAEAHTALAMILRDVHKWTEAGEAFARAVSLNPGYATAHQWYFIYLMDTGRPDEAFRELQRARELDPLSLVINVNTGWYYYVTRQFAEAITHLHKTLELEPDLGMAHEMLFWSYQQTGQMDKAIAHLPRWLTELGGPTPDLEAFREALSRAGAAGVQRMLLGFFEERWGAGHHLVAPGAAALYTRLGETGKALIWLERACESRLVNLAELRFAPDFDPLRTDARFGTLVEHFERGQFP